MKLRIAILVLFCGYCSSNFDRDLEFINPPVGAAVTQKTSPFTYYELKFSAFNIEIGFQGYGVFAAANTGTAEAFVTGTEAFTTAGLQCTNSADIDEAYVVQIGGTSQVSDTDCFTLDSALNGTTLASGVGIAIRARVDRDESPWSIAATATVP